MILTILKALFDRGAVLFIGIVVGVLLVVAFRTGGHPLVPLLADPPVGVAAAPAPVAAAACTDDFPLSRNVVARLRANQPLRIGVFGDSFGEGLWAATDQAFHGRDDFQVIRHSREGIGFTRYRTVNLLDDLKALLATQPIDIALIDFGANDTQGVWQDGKGSAYMTPGWQATIGDRITAYVQALRDQGAAVGWVGLPRMRRAEYDGDVQAMNRFQAALMCRLHVPFVDPVAVSEDAGHQFARELVDPETHQRYLARADDGIHMTFHGYEVIARPLLTRIARLGAPDAP